MADNQVAVDTRGVKLPAGAAAGANNFLRFELAGEEYGIEISRVHEVIGLLQITPVPGAPKFIRGVISLDGRVIPVVDLKVKFGMDRSEDTRDTCLVVALISSAGAGDMLLGILVDRVREVYGENLYPPVPGAGNARADNLIRLDIDKLLTGKELAQLRRDWS